MRFALLVLASLYSLSVASQVNDDFSDGDITSSPVWTGDTDRFEVVPFGGDFAVQSDGLAEADTISIATASTGSRGEWSFLFQWNFNLSTSNGTRIYLVSNNEDLTGTLQGYFLQLGTNNDDEVRLYRQDGASSDRTLLASGTEGLLSGDSGTVTLRVLRDENGLWQVDVNGSSDITGVTDNTFDTSTHLGIWLKHSTTANQSFIYDDVFQDPTVADLTPPSLIGAEPVDALTVDVEFDEEVVPEPGDYMIDNGIGMPVSVAIVPGEPEKVRLDLATSLAEGVTYTLTVTDVADLAGNVLASDETTFFFGTMNEPEPRDVVINEIMFDPPGTQPSSNEWVELLNVSDETFDLIGFSIQDDGGTPVPVTVTSAPIGPGEYAVLVNSGADFEAAFPGVPYIEVPGFPSLNNSGDRPGILFDGVEIDAVLYSPSWGGSDASLERIDPNGPSQFSSNWATTEDPEAGTPGEQNSVFAPDVTPPSLVNVLASDPVIVDVFFDEPVDPVSAGTPSNYSIDNGVGTPAVADVAPEGNPQHVQLFLSTALVPNAEHMLTATNIADLVGNVQSTDEFTFFYGEGEVPVAKDLVINEFLYDEPTTNNPAEFIELFNRSHKVFDLSEFLIEDASGETEIASDPVFVQPDGYAVLVEDGAAFESVFPGVSFVEVDGWRSLNNSGDDIVLRYETSVIDSLQYDDSWGGSDASLERIDPEGPSEFAVNWATTTDPDGGTPGALNSVYMPDISGPLPLEVAVSLDGTTLTVLFNEPLDGTSVNPGAFTVAGPVAPAVTETAYVLDPDPVVTLTLASDLALGEYLLTVTGVTDLLGNESKGATVDFTFEPDETPPLFEAAFVVDATTVEVQFTESVTEASATDTANYTIDGGIGSPSEITFPIKGDDDRALLTLANPLAERTIYTLTALGVQDPSGNTMPSQSSVLFFGEPDSPLPGELVVNEIMFDPVNGGDGEYVELLNLSENLFDLRTLELTDESEPEGSPATDVPAIIPPNSYVVLVADRSSFAVSFPDIEAPVFELGGFPSLNNDGDLVGLYHDGTAIDSVAYESDWHRVELEDATGISLERVDPLASATEASNWSSSLDERGGTPGIENTAFVSDGEPPEAPGLSIDSPFDPDAGQSTAIRYSLENEAGLVRVRIFDGAGRLVRELEDGTLTGQSGMLLWDGRDTSGRRLRIGIYIVLLEAVDVESGRTEAHRGVVVLARQF